MIGRRFRTYGLAVILGFVPLAGCASDPAGPGGGLDLNGFTPSNPGASYVPAADAAAQTQLLQDIWTSLTGPNCWDATAVLPVGHASQFQFFGQDEYRHFGFSINFGRIFVHSVGRYDGRPAAILETWTGVVEGLVVVSASEIAHVFPNVENTALVVTRYGASQGPCL